MTGDEETRERLDRLESLVEWQQETIDEQQETIEGQRDRLDALEAEVGEPATSPGDGDARGTAGDRDPGEPPTHGGTGGISRRSMLGSGGLLGLVGLGTGFTAARATGGNAQQASTPQGQVGTQDRPLEALYTEELAGGIAGGQPVTDLPGEGLTVDGGSLAVAVGEGLSIQGDVLTTAPNREYSEAPDDLSSVLAEMDRHPDGTYVITDVHELQAMNADLSADYSLGSDVDASLTNQWNGGSGFEPIDSPQSFSGSFDGNGYVVDGLTIDRAAEDNVGLFGKTTDTGSIESVGLTNVDVTGASSVGGLVGDHGGNASTSYVSGSVSGIGRVGGLAGGLGGTLSDSYATASVDADRRTGGLVGLVDNGSVSNSYATGTVSGSDRAGGLIGVIASTGSITASYWDTESTGQDGSDGGTGLTTAEMQGEEAESNMGGLSFSSPATWDTVNAGTDADVSEDNYPVLVALDRATQLEARA